jgi:hypothetical protein
MLRLAVAAVVTVAPLAACDNDGGADGVVGPADAIRAIVAWQADDQETVLDDRGEAGLPVIFVVAGDGTTIDVGVQADVASAMVDTATVRFADDVGDAFDPDVDGEPVRDDGVMLLVGPIPEARRTIVVDVDRYHTVDDWEALQMEITADAQPTGTDDEDVSVASVMAVTPP